MIYDEPSTSRVESRQESRLSYNSMRYFDFLDTHHSVFTRSCYYDEKPKVHPWSRRPCSRHSGIPIETLRSTSCSPRLDELSRPKIKREHLIRQEFFDNFRNYAYSGVPSSALKVNCSERIRRLAEAKQTPVGYIQAHNLPRAVSEQALNAKVTQRLSQLSKPRQSVLRANAMWKNKQK